MLVLMPHATVAAICAQLGGTQHLLIAIRNASKAFKTGLRGLDLQDELEKQIHAYSSTVDLLKSPKVQANSGNAWTPEQGRLRRSSPSLFLSRLSQTR